MRCGERERERESERERGRGRGRGREGVTIQPRLLVYIPYLVLPGDACSWVWPISISLQTPSVVV